MGGLLGHWAVWTRRAVEIMDVIKRLRVASDSAGRDRKIEELLALGTEITDATPHFLMLPTTLGIHTRHTRGLRRQGLLVGCYCINPNEILSPGQREEIDRVYRDYPHLNDDDFVKENLRRWLSL